MALEFPRYVHGPDGEHKRVESVEDYDQALAGGVYQATPYLTDEQKAAVKAAQIAAGEREPDPEPDPDPKKGKK
jgi:hypothetical protein